MTTTGLSYTDTNAAYSASLATALSHFQSLLSNPHSKSWKPVSPVPSASGSGSAGSASAAGSKGKARATPSTSASSLVNGLAALDPSQVKVDKKPDRERNAEIVRAIAEVPCDPDAVDLEAVRAVLATPEVRALWDKLVDSSHSLSLLGPLTRITKTDYRLGWPASPRDTITISRTFVSPDSFSLIDLSTSLPRAADEPAFLRPAPPFVRANVHLMAWCVQVLPPTAASSPSLGSALSTSPSPPASTSSFPQHQRQQQHCLRLTLFWQWSLRLPTALSSPSSSASSPTTAHIAPLLSSFVNYLRSPTSTSMPLVRGYGRGVELNRDEWDVQAEMRSVEYAVVYVGGSGESTLHDDDEQAKAVGGNLQGLDELVRRRERARLERSVELSLPPLGTLDSADAGGSADGWDVRVTVKSLGGPTTASTPLEGPTSSDPSEPPYALGVTAPTPTSSAGAPRLTLRLSHPPLRSPSHLLRVTLTVQRLAAGRCVRVNGERRDVERVDGRDLSRTRGKWDIGPEGGTSDEGASSVASEAGSIANHDAEVAASGPGESSLSIRTTPAASPSTQIASLLRRSYIYFLSLLQEPPAKWRHVSDSQGVTVTQLLSPDPTLTIYRAEAVFVGVGVWDVFATVVTPGVRKTWDKGVEEAVLVADEENGAGVGELSEVCPRDSVLLRTAYKSPSSVHIFSSSTDDTSLFPSIPPAAPGTIRTQTDLYGWSIEALSPTTTQITLLDQSDPKGWSSKSSWTPGALVQAVAGVRDYSIRNGAPPVVTRLSGGGVRKMAEEYDPEKATLRVEYSQPLTLSADAEVDSALIDCEIRCDASTWASGGIDVVVDPPPTGVSCLARHRLSAGGGLWLTIEHAQNVVAEEGKVVVTVRRGASGSGASGHKDKSLGGAAPSTSVVVNGARVKVDVEVLDEDKIRELEKRKRIKPAPVPLDQYETLGPRPGQPGQVAAFGAGRSSPATVVVPPIEEDGLTDKAAGEKVATGAVDDAPAAAGLALGANGDASAPTSDPAAVPDAGAPVASAAEVVPPKPPLDPPACALEALAWLQTFHAEQGPELTDPAPGWSIVSERGGIVVRKRLLPAVSETFPVYRGDKILQGLTAEEIASIVTSVGCRKAWDERVDNATPLASYGHGVTTCAITTKPTFPFKSRIFFVASVSAAVKVPSASSGASTSTVLFVASASYTPLAGTSSDPFDTSKVNPSSYLAGHVLLEGWILETLDPYTSSVLAIPSTRCTYVACMDQKGSVPLALNQILNANLARSISNIEQLGKTRGPLPRLWAPSACVQIEGPLSDDSDADFVWKLSPPALPPVSPVATAGEPNAVITVDFDLDDGSFRSLLKVGGKRRTREVSEDGDLLLGASGSKPAPNDKVGGGKSKTMPFLAPPLPVGTSLLKSELPRSASLNLGTAAPPILQKPPIISELSHKTSRGSLRSKSPPAAPSTTTVTAGTTAPVTPAAKTGSSSSVVDPGAHDLVVAELVVDLKQYPHGYAVTAVSQLLPAAGGEELLSLDSLPARTSTTPSTVTPSTQLPLRCVAHDAPLPSILTASLDAWKRANHLIRVLVPTGAITHPIQDPLRAGDESTKPAPPEWFRLLLDGPGALVEIRIVALPAPSPAVERTAAKRPKDQSAPDKDVAGKVTGQAAKTVVFNGEKLVVQSQKESKAVLSRFEDDELPLQGAKISRGPPRKQRKSSFAPDVEPVRPPPQLLPTELQKPLAVSARLLAPKTVTPIVDDFEFPDPKSPGNMTPALEEARSPVLGGKSTLQPSAARRDTATSDTIAPAGPLLSLLGNYQLSRLGATMMPTVDVTETSPAGVVAVRRTYTLSFVLLVALISFLLGSLLRSLLTPADYIIYRPITTAQQADVEHALLQAFDPARRWREARRLVELRGMLGWDVIVAAVSRE
ncbi:lipid-binding START domain protein [Rhodotorula toruloides]|uniref:Lipid-binding START domain protein n=1 Tax=Rhodotorula toruloides TaxID=5286 RepID=A0A511KB57_RHOTO|nr:lipid-binding START domain protein [Rhodotorula toruloides]